MPFRTPKTSTPTPTIKISPPDTNPPPLPSRPPNHHSDSEISVLDLGPSLDDTVHPPHLAHAHTQPQPPTPLAILPGADALTTAPASDAVNERDDDEEESGSTTPKQSAIACTGTGTSTCTSGQSTPVPRRGRLLNGGGGVLASLRAFSSPLLMPLRGGDGDRGAVGDGSARPGVRRARTSLWGR